MTMEEVILGSDKMDQLDRFTYVCSISSKMTDLVRV